jgi:hypothetical protein
MSLSKVLIGVNPGSEVGISVMGFSVMGFRGLIPITSLSNVFLGVKSFENGFSGGRL